MLFPVRLSAWLIYFCCSCLLKFCPWFDSTLLGQHELKLKTPLVITVVAVGQISHHQYGTLNEQMDPSYLGLHLNSHCCSSHF